MEKKHLAEQSLASVLEELLQIIRNEQLNLHSAYKGR